MTPDRSVGLQHLPSQLQQPSSELTEPPIPGSALEQILGVSPRTLRNHLRAYRE